jgi:2-isopropylmalate synthase
LNFDKKERRKRKKERKKKEKERKKERKKERRKRKKKKKKERKKKVMSNSTSRLIIFDTTLRDGEQSPGVTLSVSEKVEIAQSLLLLGVDVCEAGFPMASQGDFDAVYAIAKQVGDKMTVCALARATENDIKRAFEALKPATKKRIHTFLATSDIHLEHKLKITRQQCIEKSINAVRYAKSLGCNHITITIR